MCGIIGLVNAEKHLGVNNDYCNYIKQASTVGVLRGSDSTGMFQVDKGGIVDVHKLPLDGGMFAETKRAKSLFNSVDTTRCTILHHRAATRGNVNYENSHPFEHSDSERYLVGVHNGSLTGTPSKYDGISFDVDSDYALYRIFKDGQEAFRDIHGSYAFVWYENDGMLRIACNGERQLSIAFVHKKNAMLIASEPAMLYWLAERNSIKVDAVLQPDKFKLLTFDLEGDLRDFTDDSISKPVYKATTNNNWQHTRAPTTAAWQDVTTDKTVAAATKEVDRSLLKIGDEVEFFPYKERSSRTTLSGEVLVDGAKDSSGSPIIIDAILSNPSVALYNNMVNNQLDSIITKVRGWSSVSGSPDKLLLENPSLTIMREAKKESVVTTIPGPNGNMLSEAAFLSLASNGCEMCKQDVAVADAIEGYVGWNNSTKKPICPNCVSILTEKRSA